MSVKTAIYTKMQDSLVKTEQYLEKQEDQKLRGIKQVLEDMMLPNNTSHNKPCGWIDFNFAFELFCSALDTHRKV